MFSAIVAVDIKMGIAKEGKIPWHYSEDMEFFRKTTLNHIVIMGRKTWESLPNSYRPLPNRFNVVLSQKSKLKGNTLPDMIFDSIESCLVYFSQNKKEHKSQKKIVIGGKTIYKQFLARKLIHEMYITHIKKNYNCDLFLDNLPSMEDGDTSMKFKNKELSFHKYYITNHEERNMLNLLKYILSNGNKREDRTGTGTLSVFSRELRFDLSQWNIPLMTTRPVSLRYAFEELMWILRGQTNNTILNEKKIHIWDDNTSREFLDNRDLHHLPLGDIGASYGFQMRHYGEKYVNCNAHYKGFDQLANIIQLIKDNPTSRRIVINLWNPTQVDEMALPPCLYGYQFYVYNQTLSCKLIQRSSDIALAGSHNCAAGALFTFMLCAITGLWPGDLIWSPSDIHIYLNQLDAVKEQVKRVAKPFPILQIIQRPKDNNILNFEFDHFRLLNYDPYPRIQFAMNA